MFETEDVRRRSMHFWRNRGGARSTEERSHPASLFLQKKISIFF